MRFPFAITALWLASGLARAADHPAWVERLAFWAAPELERLKAEMAATERELAVLPVIVNVNSGNRSGFQTTGQEEEGQGQDPWVELELAAATPVDSVVLVPLLARASGGPVSGFGFPERFLLEGTDAEGEPVVLLDETGRDFPNPGAWPVSVVCPPGTVLRRVRLTVVNTAPAEGTAVLALSELLVLQGNRNMALKARVKSSSSREIPPTWSRANLTDMATPLGLPLAPGEVKRMGWQAAPADSADREAAVTVDLGREVALEEIRLVPASRGSMVWDSYYGFPIRFKVETALEPDFREARMIVDRSAFSLMSPGQNPQCYSPAAWSPQPARYIRITASRLRAGMDGFVFALGEVQAYAGGVNVAAGAAVMTGGGVESAVWGRQGLTDGSVGGGTLLELPDWFRQLERKRLAGRRLEELESRRRQVFNAAEQRMVAGSIGGAGGMVVLAGLFSWRGHRQRALERERHRERLARDLHDELGSNLGSIALTSSFAAQETEAQMRLDLAEIERVARESADSMRDMVSLLGARRGTETDWLVVLSALAARLLRGVRLDCRLPAAPLDREPDLETRRELYLFAKEVLHNASRHGQPSEVTFEISPAPAGLRVLIRDDGRGFDPSQVTAGHGLGNLRERAAMMRAELSLTSSPGQGTTVLLHLPRNRRWTRR
ncbi:MAG: ATP-binding protein [Verrucomicrobiota bacterium]